MFFGARVRGTRGSRGRSVPSDGGEGPHDYFDGLLLRSDYLDSMSLRSQANIDANSRGADPTNLDLTYDAAMDAAKNQPLGSVDGQYQVKLDFSPVVTECIAFIHDYYAADGFNSYNVHYGLGNRHKFNMIGYEAGLKNVSIANSGTTATVTDTGHNIKDGSNVWISGADQPEYNGTSLQITVVDEDTYTYTMPGDPGGSATGSPKRGAVGDRRRIEQRYYYGDPGSSWAMDTRAYQLGEVYDGVGSGFDRITPYTDPTNVPIDEWHRMIQMVDFTASPVAYTFLAIDSAGNEITVYDAVPLPDITGSGGLDRWTPNWGSLSLHGEIVTITNSGTTAIVTLADHELIVGQRIQLQSDRLANEPEYNGPQTVASVIDTDTFTYEMSGDPGGPATPASGAGFISLSSERLHGWFRNCVVLKDTSTINLAPLKVAPIA